jgi:two-component system chemotaxis response regulator CheB
MALKLLIVDDSALMRRQLSQLFEVEGDFVIRTARTGKEAIDENLSFLPDVITLDINMPEMDGLTALSFLMASRPVPVVMVSSLTERGALSTFEALALGAVDYIAKPDGTISLSIDVIKTELVRKVRTAARARPRLNAATQSASQSSPPVSGAAAQHSGQDQPSSLRQPGQPVPSLSRTSSSGMAATTNSSLHRKTIGRLIDGVVLIGVSTGGPGTLELILPKLPADFPLPIVIAQHMPGSFTGPFANRLNSLYPIDVVEANKPMPLEAGTVYIGKGGADVVISQRGSQKIVMPKPECKTQLWHPSVELLGQSALAHFPAKQIIAIMLTGMGNDGSQAFAAIHQQGGRTIAESEESCVVFGMPKELIEQQGAGMVLPAHKIASQLLRWTQELRERR